MSNRRMIGTAALLLASATLAGAQEKPPQSTPSSSGTVSLGGRFTDVDGDEARYERYRDLQNGVNANLLFGKEIESVARQPEMRDELQAIRWLGFALTEAVAFYTFIFGLIAFFL